MTRTKQFEPDEVLDRAIHVFWDKGYEATSMQDLVEAMEINRFSLYATFGGKHDLYLAACDRYRETVVPSVLDGLENGDTGLASIRSYLDHLITGNDESRRGCMLVNAAVELAIHDDDVGAHVGAMIKRIENAFYAALQRARRAGEVVPNVNLRDHARLLAVVAHGLLVNMKGGMTLEQARKVVRTALATLPLQN